MRTLLSQMNLYLLQIQGPILSLRYFLESNSGEEAKRLGLFFTVILIRILDTLQNTILYKYFLFLLITFTILFSFHNTFNSLRVSSLIIDFQDVNCARSQNLNLQYIVQHIKTTPKKPAYWEYYIQWQKKYIYQNSTIL